MHHSDALEKSMSENGSGVSSGEIYVYNSEKDAEKPRSFLVILVFRVWRYNAGDTRMLHPGNNDREETKTSTDVEDVREEIGA